MTTECVQHENMIRLQKYIVIWCWSLCWIVRDCRWWRIFTLFMIKHFEFGFMKTSVEQKNKTSSHLSCLQILSVQIFAFMYYVLSSRELLCFFLSRLFHFHAVILIHLHNKIDCDHTEPAFLLWFMCWRL